MADEDNITSEKINRIGAVLDASYEIAHLVRDIVKRANTFLDHPELSSDFIVIKGLAMRTYQLNGVILGAIDDEQETLVSLKEKLG